MVPGAAPARANIAVFERQRSFVCAWRHVVSAVTLRLSLEPETASCEPEETLREKVHTLNVSAPSLSTLV